MNIEVLLRRGEGKTIEFKRDLSSPRNILKTLTSFANTAGGVLLIGIDDETRAIFGIDQPLDEEERLTRFEKRRVPTVGGLLLFGKNRAHVFPDAWVQCGRFTGKDRTHIFDHTEIHEHLPVAVERIIDFLKKHAMRGADLSQIHRRDVWSIPLTILREAVVNAVVHADYSQKGAPIRVSFLTTGLRSRTPAFCFPV